MESFTYITHYRPADGIVRYQSDGKHGDTLCLSDFRKQFQIIRIVIIPKVQYTVCEVMLVQPLQRSTSIGHATRRRLMRTKLMRHGTSQMCIGYACV